MIAWKGTLKPKEIQAVASYILSLQGSNPVDPKAPEGEVWVQGTTP
jgi:cytochrome c oxidase cbb3-type subunit III